ncbi:hypothetical protein AV903_22610 [Erwinia tracheiphila]|uniref:Uncharacterized protein n=2 Tax=Erwinia tracheiphila TaxID=65700 RepID=A0A345CXK3_9GAMM|nr:hypothetical protein AV903_22610 [Erwinia tracheiphila]
MQQFLHDPQGSLSVRDLSTSAAGRILHATFENLGFGVWACQRVHIELAWMGYEPDEAART